ncbi:MAG: transposase, partial [Acidobacteria bacterium]|nr:transposase [Acidobacteriota bacterium]
MIRKATPHTARPKFHDRRAILRWPESGKNGYAWVTVSGPYAYYEIARSRSGEVACRQLGGPEYKGHPVTDRYVA